MVLDRIVVGVTPGPRGEDAARWTKKQFGARCAVARVPLPEAPDAGPAGPWRAWWEALAGTAHPEDAHADILAAAAFGQAAELVVAAPPTVRAAERLVRLSPVPVLLLSDGHAPGPLRRLLAAVDDAPASDAVLAWARALREAVGAEVVACHVLEAPSYVDLRHAAWRMLAGDDEALHPGEARRRWLAARLRAAGLPDDAAAVRIREGDAAEALAAEAQASGAGLLVVGTLWPELGADAPAGEVRRPLLRRSPVPVLVASPAHPAPLLDDPVAAPPGAALHA